MMIRNGARLKRALSVVGVAALLGATGCSCSDESDGDSDGGGAGEDSGAGGNTGADSSTGGSGSDDDDETGGVPGDAGAGGAAAGTAGSLAGQGGGPAGGSAGASAGTAGSSVGTAGAEQGGGGPLPTGGATNGGAGPGGGAAGSDVVTPPATLEELMGALCAWEFRCCDRGELDYRMGAVVDSAEACRERFVQQLSSNSTDNPYASGSARGLLGTLAYTIELSRVEVNTENVAACIAQHEALGCAAPAPTGAPRCAGPAEEADPCALTSLFTPILEAGERCTLGLAEGFSGGNDVECVPGTSCLDAGSGSPEVFPTCVTREVAGAFCTQDSDCDYDLYCDASGRCAEKADAGEDCGFSDPEDPVPGDLALECKAGLQCNPVSETCIEYCTTDYVCASDLECPEGQSCAPITLATATDPDTFHVCRPFGEAATARCDDSDDCVSTRYCDDGVCVADEPSGDPCANTSQCEEGTYCDGDEAECTPYAQVGDECTPDGSVDSAYSEACANPENPMFCVYDAEDEVTVCATEKLEVETECQLDSDCPSGMCELADEADEVLTCVSGAEAGDGCDSDPATGDALRCGPGLACVEEECVELLGPGESCEDETGVGSSVLCANGICAEQWDSFMCSDAAVPVVNNGSGLTCDGPEE